MSSGDCPSLNEVLQQLKVTLRKIRTLNGKSSKSEGKSVSERQKLEDIIEALEIALTELGQHDKRLDEARCPCKSLATLRLTCGVTGASPRKSLRWRFGSVRSTASHP
jgi:hypothetical protein